MLQLYRVEEVGFQGGTPGPQAWAAQFKVHFNFSTLRFPLTDLSPPAPPPCSACRAPGMKSGRRRLGPGGAMVNRESSIWCKISFGHSNTPRFSKSRGPGTQFPQHDRTSGIHLTPVSALSIGRLISTL
jgi:hypothetical protein